MHQKGVRSEGGSFVKSSTFTAFSKISAKGVLASELLFSLLPQSIPGQDGHGLPQPNFHKPFLSETAIKMFHGDTPN
jgi:hypothetical protein